MKIPKAALLVFLGASAASAFTPSPNKFGVRSHASSALRSTTVKGEDIFQQYDRNGALEKDIAELVTSGGHVPPKKEELDEKRASRFAKDAVKDFMKQYEGQSGAAIVYSKLVENGVDVVNGYSGGAVLPLLDQFHPDNPRHGGKEPIRWITNSNEASAGHIAEGYAKSVPINGEHMPVGVAIATSGPGVTNLITPLQDAICDGVPMVVLCGQAATTAPPFASTTT